MLINISMTLFTEIEKNTKIKMKANRPQLYKAILSKRKPETTHFQISNCITKAGIRLK
jgi:hypothetical protein